MADASFTFKGDPSDLKRATQSIIRELEQVSRQAVQTSAVLAAAMAGAKKEFGGVIQSNLSLGASHRKAAKDGDEHTSMWHRLRSAVSDTNRGFQFFRNIISAIKWPAIAVAIAYVVQAVNALLAGAIALVGTLGPLLGIVGAAPAAFLTLAGAIGTVVLAFGGMKKALEGDKEAFEKLTPEAQKFTKTLTGIKPIIESLRQNAQRGLFPGLTEGLNSIFSQRNVGIFQRGVQSFGKAIGDSFAELGKWLNTDRTASNLNYLLEAAAGNMRILGSAGVKLADAIMNIAVAAQPLVDWMTQLIGRFADWADTSTKAGLASGRLAAFFNQTKVAMQEWGRVLGPLSTGLINLFKASAPLGHALMKELAGAADQFERWTKSTEGKASMATYFNSALEPLKAMGRLVRDLVGAILSVGTTPALTKLIEQLRTELVPTLALALRTLISGGFAEALVKIASGIVRIIALLAGSSGPLTTFMKLIAGIVGVVADLIEKIPILRSGLFALFGVLAVGKITGITHAVWAMATAFTGVATAEGAAATAAAYLRAALISTGIGAVMVALGTAAMLIIQHWSKVGPYFKAIFTTIVEVAKGAAFYLVKYWILAAEGIMYGLKGLGWLVDKIFGTNIAGTLQKAIDKMNGVLRELAPNVGKVKRAWEDTRKSTEDATQAVEEYKSALEELQGTPIGATLPGAVGGKTGAYLGSPLAGVAPSGLEIIGGPGEGTHAQSDWQSRNAVDIKITRYTAIVSVMDGVVVATGGSDPRGGWRKSGSKLLYGYSVTIAGKAGTVFITHLDSLLVKQGQKVKRGQLLGYAEKAGHIHYARQGAQTSGQVLGTEVLTAPLPPGSTDTAIVPTMPEGEDTTTAPTKAPAAEITVVKQTVSMMQKDLSRIADPRLRAQIKRALKAIAGDLKEGITTDDLAKIQARLTKVQALYQAGLDLNPIVRKMNYWDKHLGLFAEMPGYQAGIRKGIANVRALIAKFRKDGTIDERESRLIEKAWNDVTRKIGLAMQIRGAKRYLANFAETVQEWKRLAVESLKTLTSEDILAKITALNVRLAAAIKAGNGKLIAAIRQQIADLGQQYVQAFAEEFRSAQERVTDAMSNVLDLALSEIDRKWDTWLKERQRAIGAAFGVEHGQTAAARRLAAFREARDAAAFQKQVSQANKELAESEAELAKLRATSGVSADDIRSAEERVLAAKEAVYQLQLDAQERQLQKEADAQEQAYQDAIQEAQDYAQERAALEKDMFQRRYQMIQEAYRKEEITAEEAQQQILELLGDYGIATTEAMGATYVFTKALEALGEAIVHLAEVLRSIRDMTTPSSSGPTTTPTEPRGHPPPEKNEPPYTPSSGSAVKWPWVPYQSGGVVREEGIRVGRDHVLIAASPGELVLNTAQQGRLAGALLERRGGTPIVVQINRPLLLGRSLAVADELAGSVAPAIARRVGYRYFER